MRDVGILRTAADRVFHGTANWCIISVW
jgi:hypothetical protein